MSKRPVMWLIVMLVGAMVAPALSVTINPNDDTHVERLQPDLAWNSMQLVTSFTSGLPNKIPFMEFTLGSVPATSAKLNIYTVVARGAVSGFIYAKEMEFDENTFTYNTSIGTDAPDGNTTNGYFRASNGWEEISPEPIPLGSTDTGLVCTLKTLGSTLGPHSMDLLNWYNANLGKTMVIAFQVIGPINGNETRWASKEHTTDPNAFPPNIDVVEIPEPASLILFGLAGLGLRRRRAA